jgi:anti-anti-sigma regulatory factor
MKKNTVEIMKEKKGEPRKGILTLEHEVTFANAKELLDNFSASGNKFDILVMQGNIDFIDLTGIQALYSIRMALKNENKSLMSGIKMNEETKNLILRSGFKEIFENF